MNAKQITEIRRLMESTIDDLGDWLRPIREKQVGLYRTINDTLVVDPRGYEETTSIEWLTPKGEVFAVQEHVWKLEQIDFEGDKGYVANTTVEAVRGYLDRALLMREPIPRPVIGEKDLYTTKDVATMYRVNEGTVGKWVSSGQLKAVKTNNADKPTRMFTPEALREFNERRTEQPDVTAPDEGNENPNVKSFV